MLSKLILGVLAASTAAVNVKTEERTLIHPERREQLNKIKAMATTWTAKAGRWAREAPGASAPVLGHLGNNKLNVAAAKERGEVVEFVPKLVNPIPDSFDSAKEWPKCAKLINDIRDQSNCGCCGEPASKIWPRRQSLFSHRLGVCWGGGSLGPHVHRDRRREESPDLGPGRVLQQQS